MSTSNICNFSPIRALSIPDLNRRFKTIHDYLCFAVSATSGGVVSGAADGLSIDGSGNAVLGQDVGAVGSPAALTSIREIPLNSFTVNFTDGAASSVNIAAANLQIVGDNNVSTPNLLILESSTPSLLTLSNLGSNAILSIGGVGMNIDSISNIVTFSATDVFAPKFEATDTTDTGTPNAAFRVNRTLTTGVSASGHGFRDQTVFSRPTFAYCGFDGAMTTDTTGNYDHLISFQARQNYASSGTLNDFYGGASLMTISGGGTITRAYGWDHWDITGTGTVTDQFGYHVQSLTKGTRNWGFYSEGTTTPSLIRGSLGLGLATLTAPTEKLDVSGNGKFTGNLLFNNAAAAHAIKPAAAMSGSFEVVVQGNINIDSDTNGGACIELHADDGSSSGGRINLIAYGRNGAVGCGNYRFYTRSGVNNIAERFSINSNGNVGIGQGTPTAVLHLKAGTATASSGPLKFTSGTNLTTAENGTMEFNGTNLFFTRTSATRESVLVGNSGATAPTTTIGVTIVNFYGSSATNFLGDPNSWASVNIGGTVYKIPLYT